MIMAGTIKQPRGARIKKKGFSVELRWDPGFSKQMNGASQKIQAFVDSECLRLMNPLTPRRTGFMIRSGTLGTVIGDGEIKYLAPYARKQYYHNKGTGQRGKLWFERMKAQNMQYLKKGAAEYAKRK